jgi:16S rRNA pseudouridine516 synthase
MSELLRLDRYISECGVLSRKQAVPAIKAGRVCVNGEVIDTPGYKIDEADTVTLDGKELAYSKYSYYMLNKPQGCVSAVKDRLSDTVISYLKGVRTDGLFPVGRLDKDTEGMLLITNDGQLCHELISPKKHVEKVYYVVADKELPKEAAGAFAKGIDIGDDKVCLPAVLEEAELNGDHKGFAYKLTITEGRFHQVKRMFYTYGSKVVYLKRICIGGVSLDEDLEPGAFRRLTDEELSVLSEDKRERKS